MKLKEKIQNSINSMSNDELKLLYEQIKLLESMKSLSGKKARSIPIEEIHKMTNSSKSSWSDSIIEERQDRL
jgi:hypothetical protein